MAFLDETGLTHLWAKITNKFLAKSSVANNLTTTSEGYALDARQGVTLMNAISEIGGGSMKIEYVFSNSNYETEEKSGNGKYLVTYTLKHDAFVLGQLGGTQSYSAYIDVKNDSTGRFEDGTNVWHNSSYKGIGDASINIFKRGTMLRTEKNDINLSSAVIFYFE